jgi:hypothetical protein
MATQDIGGMKATMEELVRSLATFDRAEAASEPAAFGAPALDSLRAVVNAVASMKETEIAGDLPRTTLAWRRLRKHAKALAPALDEYRAALENADAVRIAVARDGLNGVLPPIKAALRNAERETGS